MEREFLREERSKKREFRVEKVFFNRLRLIPNILYKGTVKEVYPLAYGSN